MQAARFDAVVVGAGFAGMFVLHRLRGLGLSARVFERGSDVGGTWYWNRYPGARCDVESMQYSYSWDEALQQEWRWTERFSQQPEILRYAQHVADRFNLRGDIQFDTSVTEAAFDEASETWEIRTDRGDEVRARFLIMATGCLSAGRIPDIEGIAEFDGPTYHTGAWPHEGVDFTGKRVAVIGTGSSGIQSIPMLAEQAGHVYVFQRTPNFSLPANNWKISTQYERSWKDRYAERREEARHTRSGTIYNFGTTSALAVPQEEREHEYDRRWEIGGVEVIQAYTDLMLDKAANDTAANYVRAKIRAAIDDPATAEALMPTNHPIGTKRICVDTNYFATYNRPNVTLVDLRKTPIERITASGICTSGGTFEVDSIVFATGFDAMTGALLRVDLTGVGGERLRDKWAAGQRMLLGVMTAGFPNLFTITGPGSPSVLSNVIISIEQHVEWITGLLAHLQASGATRVEADRDAEDHWVEHVNEVAARTLFPQANSWYMGANIPGKPRVFMPYCDGVGVYRHKCAEIAAAGYPGFRITPASSGAAPGAAEPAEINAPETPVFAAP